MRPMSIQEMTTIDEQPQFINIGLNKETYEMKLSKDTNDRKRLCAGCLGGTKETKKSDSNESVDFLQRPREPQQSPLATSALEEEMSLQLTKRKSSRNAETPHNVDVRIKYLENEIAKMHRDLIYIRRNMLPPENTDRFRILLDRLNEINGLLMELKLNCLRLQEASPEDECPSYGRYDECYRQLLAKDNHLLKKLHAYDGRLYSEPPRKKCIRIIEAQCNAEQYEPHTRYKPGDLNQGNEHAASPSSGSASDQDKYSEILECGRLELSPPITGEWPNCSSENSERAPRLEYCPGTHYEERMPSQQCHINPLSRHERSKNRGEKQRMSMPLDNTNFGRYTSNSTTPSRREPQGIWNTRSSIRCISEPHETFKSHQPILRNSAGNDIKMSPKRNLSPFAMASTTADSEETISHIHLEIPVITKKLSEALLNIIQTIDHARIALTVMLESNDLYHINISVTDTGQSLADVYTTEKALKEAEGQQLFERFLTFFVMNSNNSLEQKNRILGHSFAFVDMENSQRSSNVWMNKKPIARKHSYRLKHISPLNSLKDNLEEEDARATHLTQETKYFPHDIDNHDDSTNRLKAGKGGENGQLFPNIIRQWANTSALAENQNQNEIERMQSLGQRVQILQEELNQIRENKMFQFRKENQVKFNRLVERLKEFMVLLDIVWNNYKRLSRSRRDLRSNVSRHDHWELPSTSKNDSQNHVAESGSAECENFSNEINNQPTILEKHLLMMKDFRTDAELRRQRLKKKSQEKLLQKQRNSLGNKEAEYNELKEDVGESEHSVDDGDTKATGENPIQNQNYLKNHSQRSQFEPQQGQGSTFKWATTPITIKPAESVKQQQSTETLIQSSKYGLSNHENTIPSMTKDTQTVPVHHLASAIKVLPNNTEDSLANKTSLESPSNTKFATTVEISNPPANVPLIRSNLRHTIQDIIRHMDPTSVALTVVLETDQLYHINISTIDSGQSLGNLYATEEAVQQAQVQHLFSHLLTFFIVNAENSWAHKFRQLGHSFEIIKE